MDSTARALEAELHAVLVPVCAGWGLPIGAAALDQLTTYGVELLRWNEHTNLTRITAPRDVVIRHFLDSLSCAQAFDSAPDSLADIGTGAGFPGIPLKIVWPGLALVLSDSIGKKTAFLQHIVEVLELPDVRVVTARAEELGRDAAHREQYGAVVARAVAALPVLAEYCLPLCRVGGRFVAPKGAEITGEAADARRALEQLGGRLGAILPVELPGVETRTLVIVDKVRPTPLSLPRPTGVPAKHPL